MLAWYGVVPLKIYQHSNYDRKLICAFLCDHYCFLETNPHEDIL